MVYCVCQTVRKTFETSYIKVCIFGISIKSRFDIDMSVRQPVCMSAGFSAIKGTIDS